MSAPVLTRTTDVVAAADLRESSLVVQDAGMAQKVGMTRRARLARTIVIGVVFVAVIIGVFAAVWSPSAAADGEMAAIGTITVVVDEGDSLWSVVSDRSYDRDLRVVLDEVRVLNGMTSNVIHPGQRLGLPAR